MTLSELHAAYPEFLYRGYETAYRDGALHIRYDFAITGLTAFHPTWAIPCDPPKDTPALRRLVFSLGMAELVSYWKITCSPTVRVLCGALSETDAEWWKTLYFGGLGEFYYRNGFSHDRADFMTIVCEGDPLPEAPCETPHKGMLIPVGGGKDSVVTLNLLKDRIGDAYAYLINHRDSSVSEAELAGIPKERILEAHRTLDREMLRCNAEGFPNGHTPFSAIVAFSAVLTAYLHGLSQVVLSNESSASEATISESEVNHQYSKSYAFECDFARYDADFLRCGVQYFSLLRPLTEFQIARYFAGLPKAYHRLFRSCNAGSKTDIWCGHCAKCLFVAVILSPFLPYAEIRELLGADLLDDETLRPVLMALCGALPNKPFECVGSRDEVNIALCLAIAKAEAAGKALPALLAAYRETPLYAAYKDAAPAFGQEWDENHNVPAALAAIVREECVGKYYGNGV